MESESDSVPETACWDVATVGLKFFWRTKKWTVMSAYAIEMEERNQDGKRVRGYRSRAV